MNSDYVVSLILVSKVWYTYVLLDDLSDLLLVEVLFQVVLDEQLHRCSSTQSRSLGVLGDGESSTSSRLPDVLLIIIVLGSNLHLLRNEVRRVETNTKLSNHANIRTRRKSLHECLCTGFSDCSEVVDQISLGHSDTGISDSEGSFLLVGGDSDVKVLLRVELRGIGKGGISDLVKSIRTVGNQFSEENLFVRVEGVDDQVEKLGNLGLKRVSHVLSGGERGLVELTWKPKVSVAVDIFGMVCMSFLQVGSAMRMKVAAGWSSSQVYGKGRSVVKRKESRGWVEREF